jgi:PEGA domain
MNRSKMLLAAGFAVVLVGVAPPAFAQHRGGGGGHSRGGSVSRSSAVSRGGSRAVSPRSAPNLRGGVSGGAAMSPRVYSGVRGGSFARGAVASPRYSRVAPVHFYRPYYTFRPRVSLGFGLWAGYPFAYASAYYDPFYSPYGYVAPYAYGYPRSYGYAPPYGYAPSYGYPVTSYPSASSYPPSSYGPPSAYPPERESPQGSIGVQPGDANSGGLSFSISPGTAQVFVDGALVGTVGDFTPTTEPLGLVPGRHHVELRAPGYQTTAFEVDIIAGQVIPYLGTLQR